LILENTHLKLHELRPAEGSKKKEKRVGRGQSSGHGGTSGRGNKGSKARSGAGRKYGYEGGQNPIQRKMPKLGGFKNIFREEYSPVNIDKLNLFEEGSLVGPQAMREKGLIKKDSSPVKILGEGDLRKALVVRAHSFSQSAKEKIEKAGGKAEVI
jgi:large subunit ribosomal protein L15